MTNEDPLRKNLIEYKNIRISYENKTILQNFNLEIKKGEKVIITGESGSGKSTLLKAILGFVIPVDGDIFYEGTPISSQNIWSIRQKIAYVDQEFDIGVGSVLSIIKNIFAYKTNRSLVLDMEDIRSLLSKFNLPDELLSHNYETLSGGEKQRLQIIIAILLKREIFLLDEATSALDRHMKQVVMEYFIKSNHTIIAVAHDDIWLESSLIRKIEIKEQK